jgi:hypothetical protein
MSVASIGAAENPPVPRGIREAAEKTRMRNWHRSCSLLVGYAQESTISSGG